MGLLQFILDMFAEKDVKFFKSGQSWMAKGDYLRASYDFKEAISLKPLEGKYHEAFGKSLYKRRMISEAEHSFAIADDLKHAEKNPRDVSTLCRLAKAFQERRMYRVAQDFIKRALDLDPKNDQVHFLLGRANVLGNKTGEAIHEFEKAIELNSYCVEAYKALGDIYRIQAKRAKSVEYAALARQIATVKKSPQNANIHVGLGDTFRKYKRNALAECEYREALRYDAKIVDAFVGLGVLQFEGGKPSEAIENLLQALKINKYHALAHSYLGLIYKEDPRTQKEAEWETMLAKQLTILEKYKEPKKICGAYMKLGDFLLSHKKLDEAEEAYLYAIKFEASNTSAHVQLALLYSRAKKHDKALQSCDYAIMLEPEKETGYVGKGRILMEMRDYEKAISLFHEGLKYSQKNPEIHGFLSEAYKKKGLLKLAEREEKIVNAIKSAGENVI